jgi:hypothetical protein
MPGAARCIRAAQRAEAPVRGHNARVKAIDVVRGLRGSDARKRDAALLAAYDGKVTHVDASAVAAGLELSTASSLREANAAAWLVFAGARDGIPIEGGALARALRASQFPDWLVRAARVMAWRAPLPGPVVSAIPWQYVGDTDTRRMCARALTAHAITADDTALLDRLLAEHHAEFRAGVVGEVLDAVRDRGATGTAALRGLIASVARGDRLLRERAREAVASLAAETRDRVRALLATSPPRLASAVRPLLDASARPAPRPKARPKPRKRPAKSRR